MCPVAVIFQPLPGLAYEGISILLKYYILHSLFLYSTFVYHIST